MRTGTVRFGDSWDQEGELKIKVTGGLDYLKRSQVKEIRDHLSILLGDDNHEMLVGLIDAAVKCHALDEEDWMRKARALLATLEAEKGGEL